MLIVYAAKWCPHCVRAMEYLQRKEIKFEYRDIDKQPDEIVQKVIDANGGEDWVIPTLEFEGKWRKGKVFLEDEFERDLKKLGVI